MADRSYAQFCALAKALDVAGERWSLLVIRELLAGPKRYTDLLAGLPGVSTDMLAARLRHLEKAGLVTRRTLAPPAASVVYELTPDGRALEPAVVALARWGLRFLADKKRDEAFRIEWIELTLRTMFRAEHAHGPPLTIEFQVGDERLRVRIADGDLRTEPVDGARDAEVTVTSDVETLARLARDPASRQAFARGGLRVSGADGAIARMNQVFGFVPPAPRRRA